VATNVEAGKMPALPAKSAAKISELNTNGLLSNKLEEAVIMPSKYNGLLFLFFSK
jgi:hypothetical protein